MKGRGRMKRVQCGKVTGATLSGQGEGQAAVDRGSPVRKVFVF